MLTAMTLDTAPDPSRPHPISAFVIAALAFVLMSLTLTMIMTTPPASTVPPGAPLSAAHTIAVPVPELVVERIQP